MGSEGEGSLWETLWRAIGSMSRRKDYKYPISYLIKLHMYRVICRQFCQCQIPLWVMTSIRSHSWQCPSIMDNISWHQKDMIIYESQLLIIFELQLISKISPITTTLTLETRRWKISTQDDNNKAELIQFFCDFIKDCFCHFLYTGY